METTSYPIDVAKLPKHATADKIDRELARLLKFPIFTKGIDMLSLLPTFLSFHDAEHSRSVLWVVIALALMDNLAPREIELLGIAAIFHDLGFIEAKSGEPELLYENESRGAEHAKLAMLELGWPNADIDYVRELILDTALTPHWNGKIFEQTILRNPNSKYLLDADLNNLGTDNFFPNIVKLFNERFGLALNSFEELQKYPHGLSFIEDTYNFISHHSWKTESATMLFKEKEEANFLSLKRILYGC
ncbi:MAG: HD domain-containing protein [SAR324 cluster bacterium]|uniref:HD domain-containing protein n=1 Tax=SAR324 cluster bacterium TaxID=2024889 RepID=A0A7X9IMS2_9DELT|nr:HD domain-containing protein [SAR324 cluster bacterium]